MMGNEWSMTTAIGTCFAAIVALFAFWQSIKMRKNSAFNALFTHLLDNHKKVFTHKELYTNYYEFFKYKIIEIQSIRDLCDIWKEYCHNLHYSSKDNEVVFSHSFKFVYHEVITVLNNDTISELTKRRYIGIIQSSMNQDELFCYLVNLLQHFNNYPDNPNDYREQLKRFHFFDDLLREHDRRYRDVMKHLCTYLYIDVGKIIDLRV